MLVTVYGYNDLLKICQHHNSNDVVDGVVLLQNFTDWDSSKWEFVDVELSSTDYPMSATYEFRYIETEDDKTVKSATAYSLPPLFTEITVPDYMTNEDLEILGSEDIFTEYPKTTHGTGNVFMITVNAHAIQAAGFENAAEAWEAFEDQMN